jgi:hypothetical protein
LGARLTRADLVKSSDSDGRTEDACDDLLNEFNPRTSTQELQRENGEPGAGTPATAETNAAPASAGAVSIRRVFGRLFVALAKKL